MTHPRTVGVATIAISAGCTFDDLNGVPNAGNRIHDTAIFQPDLPYGDVACIVTFVRRDDGVTPLALTLTHPEVDHFAELATVTFDDGGTSRYRLSLHVGVGVATSTPADLTIDPGHGDPYLYQGAVYVMGGCTPSETGEALIENVQTGTGSGAAPTLTPITTEPTTAVLAVLAVANDRGVTWGPAGDGTPGEEQVWAPVSGIGGLALTDPTFTTAFGNGLGVGTSSFDLSPPFASRTLPPVPVNFAFDDYEYWGTSLNAGSSSGSGPDTSDGFGWFMVEMPSTVSDPGPASPAPDCDALESFNTADGPLGPDLPWALIYGDAAVVGNAAATATFGGAVIEYSFVDDQTITATVGTVTPGPVYVGLAGRVEDIEVPFSGNGYELDIFGDTGDPNLTWEIYSFSGPFDFPEAAGPQLVDGDTITLELIGDGIRALHNGVPVIDTTDTDVPSGPYVNLYLDPSVTIDSLEVDTCPPGPAVETVHPYPYGRQGYGNQRYGGDHPQVIIPSTATAGIAFLVGNDRYQLVVVSKDGRLGGTPEFRFWVAQPPAWGDVIAAADRRQILQTWAVDENDRPAIGSLVAPTVAVKSGFEATVTGVLVEFAPRPSVVGTFDGGLDSDVTLGFDCRVEGFGVPDLQRESTPPRVSGIIRSDTKSFEIPVGEVASSEWPNVLAHWFPCRLPAVRDFHPIFTNIRHVEIRNFEVFGTTVPSRFS